MCSFDSTEARMIAAPSRPTWAHILSHLRSPRLLPARGVVTFTDKHADLNTQTYSDTDLDTNENSNRDINKDKAASADTDTHTDTNTVAETDADIQAHGQKQKQTHTQTQSKTRRQRCKYRYRYRHIHRHRHTNANKVANGIRLSLSRRWGRGGLASSLFPRRRSSPTGSCRGRTPTACDWPCGMSRPDQ
ncbi:unnamed protein product [Protopolystoma xenopodis]|uniref:Uncharacterized protein n=1 Tax=Protopolystoma xenopodis TaxID=117903 RepID=A0A3S5A5Z6_9PLAT|nr:unnamed protein product [Protopolystoma xenopodis]